MPIPDAIPSSSHPNSKPFIKTESKKRERDTNFQDDTGELDNDMTDQEDTNSTMEETNHTNVMIKKEPKANVKQEEYVFSPELLSMYYSRLFPFDLLYSWLSYDPTSLPSSSSTPKQQHQHPQSTPAVFTKREFSFTIEKIPGEEIYIRYKSFPSKAMLETTICKMKPHKIDIGAVYTHPPKDKDAFQNFRPTQRELVFDIDLTDYDNVRNCGCQGAKICPKCWTMMTMAMKVMQRGLTQDFGFQHIAWFYSGRRGVHAWVCDESARTLSNDARSAIASYFEIMADTEHNQNAMTLTNPLHPLLKRSLDVLEPMFIEHILPEEGHGILASSEQWEKLLSSLPEAASKISEKLVAQWSSSSCFSTPEEKWHQILKTIDIFLKANKKVGSKQARTLSYADAHTLETWRYRTVFRYTYPRLDINVSKMQNHLLKSPFCVHPKTGRVCVPINIEKVEEFDPFDVPTLPQLMRELDEFAKEHSEEDSDSKRKLVDWQKTSLKVPFEYFQKQVLIPMHRDLRRGLREVKEEQAAIYGDF